MKAAVVLAVRDSGRRYSPAKLTSSEVPYYMKPRKKKNPVIFCHV